MVTSCARLQLFDLLNCTQWLTLFKIKRIYIFILTSSHMQQTIWYDQMQIYHSCTRESKKTAHEKLKHTDGRRSAHRIDWWCIYEKKPCSAAEGSSLSSQDQFSVTRPVGYAGLNRVVQLWDNLGHERISWELHCKPENVRLWENVISP